MTIKTVLLAEHKRRNTSFCYFCCCCKLTPLRSGNKILFQTSRSNNTKKKEKEPGTPTAYNLTLQSFRQRLLLISGVAYPLFFFSGSYNLARFRKKGEKKTKKRKESRDERPWEIFRKKERFQNELPSLLRWRNQTSLRDPTCGHVCFLSNYELSEKQKRRKNSTCRARR